MTPGLASRAGHPPALRARALHRRSRRLRRIGNIMVIAGSIGIVALLPLGVFGLLGAAFTLMAGRLLVEAAAYLAVLARCHAVRAQAAAEPPEDVPAITACIPPAHAFGHLLHELAPLPRERMH